MEREMADNIRDFSNVEENRNNQPGKPNGMVFARGVPPLPPAEKSQREIDTDSFPGSNGATVSKAEVTSQLDASAQSQAALQAQASSQHIMRPQPAVRPRPVAQTAQPQPAAQPQPTAQPQPQTSSPVHNFLPIKDAPRAETAPQMGSQPQSTSPWNGLTFALLFIIVALLVLVGGFAAAVFLG